MNSEILFKTSAVIFALLVPGHIDFGLRSIHPALSAATKKAAGLNRGQLDGIVGARNTWDSWNFTAAGIALLNYQWAITGGPQTQVEKAALALFAVGNLISGVRYGINGVLPPAIGLIIASVASLAAFALSQ